MKLSAKVLNFVLILLLALISFSIYFNSLTGEFLIDDYAGIQTNQSIHNLKQYFAKSFNFGLGSFNEMLRALIWHFGSGKPFFFHLFNVFIHVACAISLFALVNVLFRNTNLSFLTAVIFAVHPIHTEAISWISGGPYALSSLFFIVSLIFYVKCDNSIFYLILSVVFFLFCFLTGNTVASLPVILLIYELFFRKKSKADNLIARLRIYFLAALFLISIFVVYMFFIGRNKFMHTIFYFKGASYLIVVTKALVYYLKIIYLPLARGLYHPFAYNSTGTDRVTLSFFIALFIVIVSIFLFFRCLKKAKPVSFGIALFFATYLPYSNLIPVCNIVSERYVYLPSAGIAVFLGAFFIKAWDLINNNSNFKKPLRIIAILSLALFILSYAILTIKRNREYSDIMTYWKSNINNFPDGYMAYNNLAGTFYTMGQTEQALAYSWVTLMIKADQPHVWCNLGKVYFEKGDSKMAKYCYDEALKYGKNFLPAIHGMNIIKKEELNKK